MRTPPAPLAGTVASTWARTPEWLLCAGMTLVAQTTTMSVADWTRLRVGVPTGVEEDLARVIGSGIALADLESFTRVCLRGTSIPSDAARVLSVELRNGFAAHSPSMPVRDALGGA